MMLINVRFDVRPEFADSWTEINRAFTEATRAEHVNSAHFREFTGSAAQFLQRTPRIINTTAEGEEWGLMGEITVE